MGNEKKNGLKVLICGRSGAGKDYLAAELRKLGLTGIVSYTTRPKRSEDEDTHIFITPEEAAQFADRAAATVINGYEYFATRQQVENADYYIIDPAGIKDLAENMPDTCFAVLYVESDPVRRKEKAVARAADPEKEAEVYASRIADEDAQFSEFEEMMDGRDGWLNDFDNICGTAKIANDYTPASLQDAAWMANLMIERHRSLLSFLPALVRIDAVSEMEEGRIMVFKADGDVIGASYPVFAGMLSCSEEGRVRVYDALMDAGLLHIEE